MSAALPGAAPDVPQRGWDLAVVAVSALVLGLIAASSPAPWRLGVLAAALVVLVAAWFAFGRRALDGGRGWLPMLCLLVAVCAIGAAVSPVFAVFQGLAFPLAWTLPARMRTALVANLAVAAAVGVGYALGTSLLAALAVQGLSLAFSFAMGFWISRIEQRSQRRQDLVDRLTAAQSEVAALNREAGAVAERERLARELHDTLTQSLTGIVMLAERARARHPDDPGLAVLEDAGRQAMTEARGLVAASAGVPLDGGLDAALVALAERFRRETGLEVRVDVTAEVPRSGEVVVLRCAQEGLANVRKHAQARAVSVVVTSDDDHVVLTVADDGRGPGSGDGFGLAGMRDRLALVGGEARLTAGPAAGSVLTVRMPLRAEVTA